MKLITFLLSTTLLFLNMLSTTLATPLPIPTPTAITSSPTSLLTRDFGSECTDSGGHWNDSHGWCVCAGLYVAPEPLHTCQPGQGYNDAWKGPLTDVSVPKPNGASKSSVGFFGLTVAVAAAMVLL